MSEALAAYTEEIQTPPLTIPQIIGMLDEFIMLRVTEIDEFHQERKAKDVTVEALDDLIVDSLELEKIVDALSAISTKINKSRMRHASRAGNYLEVLQREDYESPEGVIEIKREWKVNMPESDEDMATLFNWMKEQGIFEHYATVNSKKLNTLFKAEWEAAKKKDPEMEVLFSMPGVPNPQLNEFTTIKAPRGKRSKRKELEDE